MAIPSSKVELLEAIQEQYRLLKLELSAIASTGRVHDRSLPGHSLGELISVKEQIAYLVGWTGLVLKWYHEKNEGRDVDFPETGFKWNQLGLLAQKFYLDQESLSFDEIFLLLDKQVLELVTLIESLSDNVLYGLPWYEKYTLGRMIQLNTSSPFKSTVTVFRKWKKQISS